ncbi:MAG TPA: SCO family protein [Verrucomicrobiae bacterium]|nr:SCO family protein [Verrucomicrobiae bacterium]
MTCSCERPPQSAGPSNDSTTQHSTRQVFQVKGVVVAVKPREKSIEIKHEAIPNYMPGMTMPFDVKDTNELTGLAPGDPVSFRLTVTDTDGWIDEIHKITGQTNSAPSQPSVVVLRDVPRLDVGDMFPEYHLTNQFGQAFSTTRFKGQAFAITFLFTRCPFPTFCPRMANNFEEVQQALLGSTTSPTNWHLLTISFDPDFDTPAVLKAYAEAHQYRPEHWTFATGSLSEITTLGDQFGLTFWRENGSINHNLRTIVVDSNGRVRKVYEGNAWTSAELAKELGQAAK